MPKKGVEPVRREQLIRATFQTIGIVSPRIATRRIGRERILWFID